MKRLSLPLGPGARRGGFSLSYYHLYRLFHYLLTGIHVRVGNFSVIPPRALKRIVAVSELWNHYAARPVPQSEIATDLVPTQRAKRLEGAPRMDMVSLVAHGLSAMAVFGDRIGVRLLFVIGFGMALSIIGLVSVFAVRVATDLAIPGWATYLTGILLVMIDADAPKHLGVCLRYSRRAQHGQRDPDPRLRSLDRC